MVKRSMMPAFGSDAPGAGDTSLSVIAWGDGAVPQLGAAFPSLPPQPATKSPTNPHKATRMVTPVFMIPTLRDGTPFVNPQTRVAPYFIEKRTGCRCAGTLCS